MSTTIMQGLTFITLILSEKNRNIPVFATNRHLADPTLISTHSHFSCGSKMWYIHDPPNVIKNNTNFQLSWIGTQNFLFNPNIQTFSSLTMKWLADPAAAGGQASWPDIDHHRDSWFLITVKNEQFHSSHTQKMFNYVTSHSQAVFFFVCVCVCICVCVCVVFECV